MRAPLRQILLVLMAVTPASSLFGQDDVAELNERRQARLQRLAALAQSDDPIQAGAALQALGNAGRDAVPLLDRLLAGSADPARGNRIASALADARNVAVAGLSLRLSVSDQELGLKESVRFVMQFRNSTDRDLWVRLGPEAVDLTSGRAIARVWRFPGGVEDQVRHAALPRSERSAGVTPDDPLPAPPLPQLVPAAGTLRLDATATVVATHDGRRMLQFESGALLRLEGKGPHRLRLQLAIAQRSPPSLTAGGVTAAPTEAPVEWSGALRSNEVMVRITN